MIKLLLVVCNNVLNGTERYVLDLASNLPKDKFDVTVATPLPGKLSDLLIRRKLKEFVYDNGKIEYYSFRGLRNLFLYIIRNKIDIVHANAKFQPCVIGKLAGVKATVETKHGIFYSSDQLKKLPLLRKIYEHFKQYFVDRFIAISEFDKMTLIKQFKIEPDKISVIYNGIDFKLFPEYCSSDVKSKKNTEIVIGNIGRLTFQKNQELLIESLRLLHARFKNVKLEMVGDGENKKMLLELIDKYGLENNVNFIGYVDNIYEKIQEFYVLVLTSRYEGTPYVIFEAMALGVPIITTNVGGISNILKDGYDALITPPEDAFATMKAIEILITDTELRNSIIRNAKETVKRFHIEKMSKETSDLYISQINS